MKFDPNEMGALITNCTNAAYLYNLHRQILDRLQQLGHTGGYGELPGLPAPAQAPPEEKLAETVVIEESRQVVEEEPSAESLAILRQVAGSILSEIPVPPEESLEEPSDVSGVADEQEEVPAPVHV